jgi:site-specific recombinase XerC
MVKFKRAKLKVNNGSVVVYYSNSGTMRYPTGVVINKKKGRDGKFLDWDYKDNLIKPIVSDYEQKKAQMEKVLNIANDILTQKQKDGDAISAAELEKILNSKSHEKTQVRQAGLREEYELFYERKKKSFAARGMLISLKDYTSFKHLLEDYEAVFEKKLRVRDVDEVFLEDLLNWLRAPAPKMVAGHVLKTQGRLGEKTLQKRFSTLHALFVQLKRKGKVQDAEFIKVFMQEEIKPLPNDKVSLTIEEVHQLYDQHFTEPNYRKVRDLFVLACLTGLRWADIVDFDSRFIIPSEDGTGKVYKRTASKTKSTSGKSFEIPLCDIVLEILERYGGSLKPLMVSNVEANRRIKEVLKATGRFDQITELRDKETKELLRRWEAVTMHKGRDTFITNLVDNAPLNEIMKYTAHTKLSTLQGYIDKKRKVSMKYIKIFNRKTDE